MYQADGDPRPSGPGFGGRYDEKALALPLRWEPRLMIVNSTVRLCSAIGAQPVGAESSSTSCHLQILVDEAAEPISSQGLDGRSGVRGSDCERTTEAGLPVIGVASRPGISRRAPGGGAHLHGAVGARLVATGTVGKRGRRIARAGPAESDPGAAAAGG
jgi:hypothetical protein